MKTLLTSLFFFILFASSPAFAQEAISGGGFKGLLPIILIFVIFYLFLIRPQSKRLKEHNLMTSQLSKGDKIITSGGIEAVITKAKEGEDHINALISDGVEVKILRSTVHQLTEKATKKTSKVAAKKSTKK